MTKGRWYAIRTKPGSQRMAAHREDRPGELIIERNLRQEGIDFYLPAYWHETIHHRKKIWLEKRYPLLVGYCFVRIPDEKFEAVRKTEGVMCFIRGSREFGPVEFPEQIISDLVMADFKAKQDYLFDQHQRREDERLGRVKKLRADLRRMLPKGRAIRVNMTDQASKIIDGLPERVRDRVKTIVSELEALTEDELIAGLRKSA